MNKRCSGERMGGLSQIVRRIRWKCNGSLEALTRLAAPLLRASRRWAGISRVLSRPFNQEFVKRRARKVLVASADTVKRRCPRCRGRRRLRRCRGRRRLLRRRILCSGTFSRRISGTFSRVLCRRHRGFWSDSAWVNAVCKRRCGDVERGVSKRNGTAAEWEMCVHVLRTSSTARVALTKCGKRKRDNRASLACTHNHGL